MTIFYIPNPTQYLDLTSILLTINKQQNEAKVIVNGLLKGSYYALLQSIDFVVGVY